MNDHQLKAAMEDQMKKDVADRMTACMETAGTNDTMVMSCKNAIKEEMKRSSLDGKKVSATKLQKGLKDAGKEKAKEAMQDCDSTKTRADCQTEAKEKMAKAMGLKSGADIKSGEFEAKVADAAVDAAAKAAKACKDARKDNAAATCEDLSEKFNAARGTTKPQDAK